MDDRCNIGLHDYTDWRDSHGEFQSRTCRQCRKIEERRWEPEGKAAARWRDPYDDLTR